MRQRPDLRRGGFSLVELLVALLILGMIAGIVTLSWEAILPSTRLESDVRALSARLHGARSDAIARNAEFWLLYDIDGDNYWVQAPYDAEGRIVPMDQAHRDEPVRAHRTQLRDGVRLVEVTIDGRTYTDSVGGFPYVRFDPLGASSDHTVVLHQASFDRYYTIEVLGLTGQIRFHEGHYRPEPPTDADFR
jgi:prepilin-type N-terminal cleavage/methylation domain-containing protein